MPKKLQSFEFTRGSSNYDWEKWCDGNVWKLEVGVDFNSELHIFRAAFSSQCKRREMKGKTQTVDDKKYIVIQAFSDNPKPKVKSRKKASSKK